MKALSALLLYTVFLIQLYAVNIHGKVINTETQQPIQNAYVQLINTANNITFTDIEGRFEFRAMHAGTYYVFVQSIGFESETDTLHVPDVAAFTCTIQMKVKNVAIPEIIISARNEVSFTTINAIDSKLRPINTTQDLLRIVPGLFIAQHTGGGKAEQLFLRGFDVDHGTDVAIHVDGMPVNMVSHAHGQGYADLHFVIPETVDHLTYAKGSYDAKTGNFNTAGAVKFQTKNTLPKNLVKLEVGRFNTYRGLAMVNLLPHKDSSIRKQSAYIASEYFYTKGFFERPQDFHRFNIFGKYHGELSEKTFLTISLSSFTSRWDASGQIPERAIESGLISRYGSIDSTEGGNTSRTNLNVLLTSDAGKLGTLKNQFYMVNYNFSLYSNFTMYKDDALRGDEIHQYENRNIYGYTSSLSNDYGVGKYVLKTSFGGGYRGDFINNIGLAHVEKRAFLYDTKKGSIKEQNLHGFVDASLLLSARITLNAGCRYDYFFFQYTSKLDDTTSAKRGQGILSPKANVYYKLNNAVQFYTSGGYGFHSNDTRVSVYNTANSSLPRSKSFDLGINLKIGHKLFINAAVWCIYLQSEYVYVGDEGLLEPSGRTKRVGMDISMRYQVLKWLYADVDLNLARPHYIDLPKGENYVPLAPDLTSTGGMTVKAGPYSGSIRYRCLTRRPAVEDNSIHATGYFIMDMVLNYQLKQALFGLTVENMMNQNWREAQFATESRLRGEAAPVTEIHFTPGTPFFIKGTVAYSF